MRSVSSGVRNTRAPPHFEQFRAAAPIFERRGERSLSPSSARVSSAPVNTAGGSSL
jgi:hypothetical protein